MKATDQQIETVSVAPYDENEMSMWQALKANPRVIMYSVIVNLGPILYGYDVIVSGAIVALPGFLNVYGAEIDGYLSLPATWQALWTAFVQLGIMIGALSGGWIQDRFGRRLSFFLGGFVSAIGVGIAYGSGYLATYLGRRLAFFFAKICIGLGMGFLIATCQTYISEITSPKIRGPMLGLYTFMSTVGQIISITIIFKRVAIMDISSFEIPFATQWVFSGLCMVAAVVIPESPVYLLSKSRVEAAEAAYQRLHGPNVDSHAAICRLWATVEHEQEVARNAKSIGFLDCFKGTDMRRTRIILILNAIPQFCGIAIIANGTYYMELCGMSATESFQLAEIGIGLLMTSTVISWFAISTIGRRFIIIASPIVVGLLYMGMGIAGTFSVTDQSAWAVGIMLILTSLATELLITRLGIRTAILSATDPGAYILKGEASYELARELNEYAAEMQDKGPGKFSFFTSSPNILDTEAALEEIRYALDTLHTDGMTLFTRYGEGNTYLGHHDIKPIWAELNRRKCVMFMHPTHPVDRNKINAKMPQPMIDYPHETSRSAMDMIMMGTRSKYPDCKVILSHTGGTLPYLISRIATPLSKAPALATSYTLGLLTGGPL
ncbi:hypothetical protein SBRCBS47491_008722 [Sporothrix bragantina]|uniref:Major facilitator superfamily (MFS) profile domain-containing protein n=1 Tax=Sporothrix bragantina TaxID=671064 RepID=A0ABP0CRY9_9PEZI